MTKTFFLLLNIKKVQAIPCTIKDILYNRQGLREREGKGNKNIKKREMRTDKREKRREKNEKRERERKLQRMKTKRETYD